MKPVCIMFGSPKACFFFSFSIEKELTGLDNEQIEALKKAFEGFDKEQSGIISGTAMQMIFKMMGVNVQVGFAK